MFDTRRPPQAPRPRVYRRPDGTTAPLQQPARFNNSNSNSRPYGGANRTPYGRDRYAQQQQQQPGRPGAPKKFFRQPEIKITNDMQVTDGKHKGAQMQSTASPKVRPTARRVRETLFKILGRRIRFARFLDLCAGCGAVGVEAISRGALLSTFVERSAKMCHFIKLNLDACEICPTGHGEIVQLECVPFLKRMQARRRTWDIVYFDPPYEADYDEVLEILGRGTAIKPQGGILVVEHHAEMFFPERIGRLRRRKVVREGDTALSFYERWN